MATAPGFSPSLITASIYTVPAQNGVGSAVSIVLTTDDQSRKMQPQAGTNFTTAANGQGRVIYGDQTQTYQPIEGFGAAFTDSAAYLLNEVASPKSALTSTMNDLFTRNGNGIGLSFMRTPMGASDIARSQYSYDDSGGAADPTLANFFHRPRSGRRHSNHPAGTPAQSADEADGQSVEPARLDEDL